jgi:hypothetical protein
VALVGSGLSAIVGVVQLIAGAHKSAWLWLCIAGLLLAVALARVAWRALAERDTALEQARQTAAGPTARLTDLLSAGLRLRSVLVMAERELPFDRQEPLFEWARQTYDFLAREFPDYADRFYGDSPELGSGYLALAFSNEIKQWGGRQRYLETRIALLSELVESLRASAVGAVALRLAA